MATSQATNNIRQLPELYLGGHQPGHEHHEGEHVEAHVVVPLPLVHLASEEINVKQNLEISC